MIKVPEKQRRVGLTIASCLLWAIAVTYLILVVQRTIAPPWGFGVSLFVGAAVVATVVRLAMRTQHLLSQVFRAGYDAGRNGMDDQLAHVFRAGMEAGRYMEHDPDGEPPRFDPESWVKSLPPKKGKRKSEDT